MYARATNLGTPPLRPPNVPSVGNWISKPSVYHPVWTICSYSELIFCSPSRIWIEIRTHIKYHLFSKINKMGCIRAHRRGHLQFNVLQSEMILHLASCKEMSGPLCWQLSRPDSPDLQSSCRDSIVFDQLRFTTHPLLQLPFLDSHSWAMDSRKHFDCWNFWYFWILFFLEILVFWSLAPPNPPLLAIGHRISAYRRANPPPRRRRGCGPHHRVTAGRGAGTVSSLAAPHRKSPPATGRIQLAGPEQRRALRAERPMGPGKWCGGGILFSCLDRNGHPLLDETARATGKPSKLPFGFKSQKGDPPRK